MDKAKVLHPYQAVQPADRLVYLVTSDSDFAAYISQQIVHFGYTIQHVREIKGLANGITDPHSLAVLIDIPSHEHQPPDDTFFEEAGRLQIGARALVFVSDYDDQVVRMKSLQAGSTAFFTKPVDIVSLIDTLDSLNRNISSPQPPRVLIVEDQFTVASYYQMVLKMAGMDAQVATKSGHVLEMVREYHPDLILLDTFMAETNTADLARVIRQISDFVSIPIIFLSSEDDFSKRIEALDLGGDDFLIKPIKAAHLKAVVRSRLERSRILRSFMVRDSLTNLLNHTAFRSVLAQEVNRCKRQNSRLALAMLDIDHFKMVNDSYGHSAGDSVLKGLSRLLKQRLPNYDIVGRYGGDELVALLIDTDEDEAFQIMDEIRNHFSEIEFYPDNTRPLHLTFSCGVSTFPENLTAETLSDSADRALYSAKAGGRNLVYKG